jgi:predicted SAM-dependent methyltransferase
MNVNDKMINLGCGSCFHSSWINIDFVSSSPDVIAHDLTKGIPFPDAQFYACYTSHLIEHLSQKDAKFCLLECFRILKPQGIIRVVVPNLESIVRNYLIFLDEAENGIAEADLNYDWTTLELFDQAVRDFSGGEMAKFLRNSNLGNAQFIRSRLGIEYDKIVSPYKHKESNSTFENSNLIKIFKIFQKIRIFIARKVVRIIAGISAEHAFESGIFRQSGEIHRWMYDRYSLRRLLEALGFINIRVCHANESSIPNFLAYSLDVYEGSVRKPDSLFIEGIKP